MIPIIPEKRRDGSFNFLQLVSYVCIRNELTPEEELKEDLRFRRPSRSRQASFDRLVDYMRRSHDSGDDIEVLLSSGDVRVNVDGVACQHNCFSLEIASEEMKAVALQNTRCQDPVFHSLHFVLARNRHTGRVRYFCVCFGFAESTRDGRASVCGGDPS